MTDKWSSYSPWDSRAPPGKSLLSNAGMAPCCKRYNHGSVRGRGSTVVCAHGTCWSPPSNEPKEPLMSYGVSLGTLCPKPARWASGCYLLLRPLSRDCRDPSHFRGWELNGLWVCRKARPFLPLSSIHLKGFSSRLLS